MSDSKSRAVDKIHESVEAAIETNMSIKDFVRNASVSWEQVLEEQKASAKKSFQKLLDVNGVY